MNLDIENWKEFVFGKLITDIYKSKALNKDDLNISNNASNNIRYITRTGENNGCELIADTTNIPMEYVQKGNAITIGDTTATCFYQSEQFITGDHMVVVRADWLNETIALYILAILNNEQYKYSYGRAFLINRIQETIIKLPIRYNSDKTPFIDNAYKYSDKGYVPDWQWMENYIKSLHHKPLTTKNKTPIFINLKIEDWKEFKVDKLFRIEPTKGKVSDDLIEGFDVPYIGAKHDLNGLMMSCQKEGFEDWVSLGNCIVFIQLGAGSAGYANYIESDFIGMSGKTSCGYIDGVMNKYIGLFLATILCLERPKYSFGRSWTGERLNETMINLPIKHNDDGTPYVDKTHQYSENGYVPDWEFMENYIKSLPYGDRI